MNYTFCQKGIKSIDSLSIGEMLATIPSTYSALNIKEEIDTTFYLIETSKGSITVSEHLYWGVFLDGNDTLQWVSTSSLQPGQILLQCHDRIIGDGNTTVDLSWVYGLISKSRTFLAPDNVFERLISICDSVQYEKRAMGYWVDASSIPYPTSKSVLLECSYNLRSAYLAGLFDSFGQVSASSIYFNSLTPIDAYFLRLICQSVGIGASEVREGEESKRIEIEGEGNLYNLDKAITNYSSKWTQLFSRSCIKSEYNYSPASILRITKGDRGKTYRLHTDRGYILDGFLVY